MVRSAPRTTAAGTPAPLNGARPAAVPDQRARSFGNVRSAASFPPVLGLTTGHLVYAKGSEEPARHVVRRSGVEILCHALDLDASPAALLAEIHGLAAHIAEHGESHVGPSEIR
jgi:hypothetical protein